MQFYHSKLLNSQSNISHAFTTKYSGNIAFHVGDNHHNVQTNHENLAKALTYTKDSLIHMKQIHSADVHIVQDSDNFSTPPTCDALITNKKATPLMVMVADCSPLLFYDSTQQVIAVAHAGRQGAFKNIVQKTLTTMQDSFKSHIADISVSIGPSIGACCYEVGEEINTQAQELYLDYSMQKRGVSFYLDVNAILKKQLLDAGIREENMEFANICTSCNHTIYNSYRAEPHTGRFCGVIYLN